MEQVLTSPLQAAADRDWRGAVGDDEGQRDDAGVDETTRLVGEVRVGDVGAKVLSISILLSILMSCSRFEGVGLVCVRVMEIANANDVCEFHLR